MRPQHEQPGFLRELTVSEFAAHSGVVVSTLHFSREQRAKLKIRETPETGGMPTVFQRRLAVIKVAQRMGIPLASRCSALTEKNGSNTSTFGWRHHDPPFGEVGGPWRALLQEA